MNVDVLVSKEGWLGSFQVYIVQNKDAITHLWKHWENYLMTLCQLSTPIDKVIIWLIVVYFVN
jgi:hypothetical protein